MSWHLLTNMAKEEGAGEEDDEDKVALSTIHQAKGWNWSYVFFNLVRGRHDSAAAGAERRGRRKKEERNSFMWR